jgi:hypothetical protein
MSRSRGARDTMVKYPETESVPERSPTGAGETDLSRVCIDTCRGRVVGKGASQWRIATRSPVVWGMSPRWVVHAIGKEREWCVPHASHRGDESPTKDGFYLSGEGSVDSESGEDISRSEAGTAPVETGACCSLCGCRGGRRVSPLTPGMYHMNVTVKV